MKKVDFRKIQVEDIEGGKRIADISRELGNLMYMQGMNIDECELGRDIYHHGEVELDDKSEASVRRFSQNFPFVMRSAVENLLTAEGAPSPKKRQSMREQADIEPIANSDL